MSRSGLNKSFITQSWEETGSEQEYGRNWRVSSSSSTRNSSGKDGLLLVVAFMTTFYERDETLFKYTLIMWSKTSSETTLQSKSLGHQVAT